MNGIQTVFTQKMIIIYISGIFHLIIFNLFVFPCFPFEYPQATAYPKISHAKATTCVSTKSSSRAYGTKYLKGSDGGEVGPSTFVRVINQINIMGGDMACFQGGILLKETATGDIVGSVGVSGAAGDEDEYCALEGVKQCSFANELTTVPESHSCKTLMLSKF
jgi:uncharacterized protein GlcG (DUF336 family)